MCIYSTCAFWIVMLMLMYAFTVLVLFGLSSSCIDLLYLCFLDSHVDVDVYIYSTCAFWIVTFLYRFTVLVLFGLSCSCIDLRYLCFLDCHVPV